jgi:hypothetical protein
MMRKIGFWTGLVFIAGCATTNAEPVNEAAAEKLAQYERTGDMTTCLGVRQISSITAVDERTLLVQTGVNDYYVSDLKSDCNGATRNSTRFEYSTSTGQLCRGEIIRIVDNGAGFLTGSCGMGSFERLAKKPAAE